MEERQSAEELAELARLKKQHAEHKAKKNPLGEFAFYYVGTLFALYVLDGVDILSPGLRALAQVPEGTDAAALIGPGVMRNAAFVGAGLVLAVPMHLWRMTVKGAFHGLAVRGAGLRPGSLKYDKFREQAWLATHYTIVVALEVFALTTQTELWPPLLSQQARDAVLMTTDQVHAHQANFWVRLTYLVQFTFYFLELATLVLDKFSRMRSDAAVYAIHHVLTVFLISFSFLYESSHVGILVLLFHDVPDVFLPIAKCFVYCEDHARVAYSRRTVKQLEIAGVLFFIGFLVSMGFLRLVLFPALIHTGVYKANWWARDWDCAGGADHCLVPNVDFRTARFYLTSALLLLFPLHVYWFRCAVRVAYRALYGLYDDERSADEYSDEDGGEDQGGASSSKKTN